MEILLLAERARRAILAGEASEACSVTRIAAIMEAITCGKPSPMSSPFSIPDSRFQIPRSRNPAPWNLEFGTWNQTRPVNSASRRSRAARSAVKSSERARQPQLPAAFPGVFIRASLPRLKTS